MQTTFRTFAISLTCAATAALTGCTVGRVVIIPRDAKQAEVVIRFRQDQPGLACPYKVVVRKDVQCEKPAGVESSECLFVDRSSGQPIAIRFQPELDDAKELAYLDFSIEFDPFARGRNVFQGKLGAAFELTIPQVARAKGAAPKDKVYTYDVLSEGCPNLDPQIIIRD